MENKLYFSQSTIVGDVGDETVMGGIQDHGAEIAAHEQPTSPTVRRKQESCFKKGIMANGIKVVYSNVATLTKNKKLRIKNINRKFKPQIIALTEACPKHKVLDIDTTIKDLL